MGHYGKYLKALVAQPFDGHIDVYPEECGFYRDMIKKIGSFFPDVEEESREEVAIFIIYLAVEMMAYVNIRDKNYITMNNAGTKSVSLVSDRYGNIMVADAEQERRYYDYYPTFIEELKEHVYFSFMCFDDNPIDFKRDKFERCRFQERVLRVAAMLVFMKKGIQPCDFIPEGCLFFDGVQYAYPFTQELMDTINVPSFSYFCKKTKELELCLFGNHSSELDVVISRPELPLCNIAIFEFDYIHFDWNQFSTDKQSIFKLLLCILPNDFVDSSCCSITTWFNANKTKTRRCKINERRSLLEDDSEELVSLRTENERLKSDIISLKTKVANMQTEKDANAPWFKCMTRENVIEYIASKEDGATRDTLISLIQAISPKSMHKQFKKDIQKVQNDLNPQNNPVNVNQFYDHSKLIDNSKSISIKADDEDKLLPK